MLGELNLLQGVMTLVCLKLLLGNRRATAPGPPKKPPVLPFHTFYYEDSTLLFVIHIIDHQRLELQVDTSRIRPE
jgi:hypothetical protein